MAETNLGSVFATLELRTKSFEDSLKQAQSAVSSIGGRISNSVSAMSDSFGAATKQAALLTTGMAAGLGGAVAFGVKSAASLQQTRVAFETMLHSGEKAGKLMQELSDFAASTPFEFPELADAGKKLLAFGFAASDIQPNLRRLGDVASGLGIPIGELSELYGKARVQGRLYMEDINQLTGRGIPITEELAKQFKVSTGQVRDLVEEGKIGFPELQKGIENMTNAGGQFAGGMENQSKTLNGLISTAQDTFGQFVRSIVGISNTGEIADHSIFAILSGQLNTLLATASTAGPKIAAKISMIVENVIWLFEDFDPTAAWEAWDAVFGPRVADIITVFVEAIGRAVTFVKNNSEVFLALARNVAIAIPVLGLLGITVAILTNPLVLWSLAIAAIALGIQLLIPHLAAIQERMQPLIDVFALIWKWIVVVAERVQGELVQSWEQLKAAIEPILPVLKFVAEVIGVLLVAAVLLAISVFGTLITATVKTFTGIVQVISGAIQIIKGIFEFLAGVIVGIMTGNWDYMKKGWSDLVNGIGTIIGGLVNIISGTLGRVFAVIKNVFIDIYNFLIGHSIIPDLVNGIVDWFGQLPGRIWGAIKGVIDSATTWGQNLMSNFINGIKNMAGAVGNAVKGVADKIKGFLGFGSPTKLGPGRTADEWIPNLLNMMIDQAAALGPKLGATLGQAVNPSISGSIIPGGMAAAGAGGGSVFAPTIQIGMYAGSAIEKREIAAEIIRAYDEGQAAQGKNQIGG